MLGLGITRETALRVLTDLQEEIMVEIRRVASDGEVPKLPGHYRLWVDKREERWEALEAVKALISRLPVGKPLSIVEVAALANAVPEGVQS